MNEKPDLSLPLTLAEARDLAAVARTAPTLWQVEPRLQRLIAEAEPKPPVENGQTKYRKATAGAGKGE